MPTALATVQSAAEALRRSRGYWALPAEERGALDRNLGRIETALRRPGDDPFAIPLETPADLRAGMAPSGTSPATPSPAAGSSPAAPRPTGTEVLGERARRTLEAVDFPAFVAGLIQGTFQAIVDATAQQVREYAKLVADLSRSVDEFTRENVSTDQARDWLVQKHSRDLMVVLPRPGERGSPRVAPRPGGNTTPAWLGEYELGGEELTAEVAEGPLLQAGRRALGEERMRLLANMVLLGISRIVVDDGQLRARLQFHARAREQLSAQVVAQGGGQQLGIAARDGTAVSQVATMVSTVDVNAQADVSLKAELTGEVAIRFRTETFDLQRFADANAIALINRHAQDRRAVQEEPPPVAPSGTGERP